jgi:hypothetical protein
MLALRFLSLTVPCEFTKPEKGEEIADCLKYRDDSHRPVVAGEQTRYRENKKEEGHDPQGLRSH